MICDVVFLKIVSGKDFFFFYYKVVLFISFKMIIDKLMCE